MTIGYLHEMTQIIKNIPVQILNIHEKPHVAILILGEMKVYCKNLN